MGAKSVSIHAPVRERRVNSFIIEVCICFNSRSREGATSRKFTTAPTFSVSIHAPVRERLIFFCQVFFKKSFNSRSREGATRGLSVLVA